MQYMKRHSLFAVAVAAVCAVLPLNVNAAKLLGLKVIDKDYLMVHFRDGEVHYRDNGTGQSAYRGHDFVEGDDTLVTFLPRIDLSVAADASKWLVSSADDRDFGSMAPEAAFRKSKPMNIAASFDMELDHWIFLKLPKAMRQGCTYSVTMPEGLGAEQEKAQVKFDIWSSQSEAVHVNIMGYSPLESVKGADLYLWLGDGGPRDYSSFEGNKVWLYNVNTGKSAPAGKVKFWKKQSESVNEAGKKDLTGSDVWTIDFNGAAPGKYRLVVDGVGCSMDFDIDNDIYHDPYRYSVLGYYYMRLGEPMDGVKGLPAPRQPQFIPEQDPVGFTVYLTDLQPWHPEWRKLGGDVWDEPHFKSTQASGFWKHRLPGNPTNPNVNGGHSDAFDWDRHLAHVSNIYDLLLPYILTGGRLSDDDLGIRESGNGIPDIIDEARNEVDFFLSIRGLDGGYSQGITNPSKEHSVMFQAGCTTMAAWANAANCAMLAEAFRINGNDSLRVYYTGEATTAFEYASRQENSQLDDSQSIGTSSMTGHDFRQLAAAYLYNVTGDRKWEDIMKDESKVTDANSPIFVKAFFRGGHYQIWGTAAYLACPHERHYPQLYADMKASVNAQADQNNVLLMEQRPSRRAANDSRWQTAENLQLVMMAHYIADTASRKAQLERAMYFDASWCLGRNPANVIEMTGLGQRHITDCYSTGRNDGFPGTHPGQTPFNGTETWSQGNGGDARIILDKVYPAWEEGWPKQESFFNQRYFWVNGEFTPRETMRGKMALLGYLYGIRK